MTMTLTMTAHELGRILNNAMLACAPTKDARPVLASVHVVIDAKGLLVESTDSQWLLEETVDLSELDVTGPGCDILIETRDLAPIVKQLNARDAKSADATLSVSGVRVTVTVGPSSFTVPVLDGSFPNTRQLWAAHASPCCAVVSAFGSGLFAKVAKVVPPSECGRSSTGYPFQIFSGETEMKPSVLRWQSGSEKRSLRALVMPIRVA